MLDKPIRHHAPYALVTFETALSDARCAELEALFGADVTWTRHADDLYECCIADVTDRLDRPWLRALTRRMTHHLDLPLTDAVQVTIQRMEPGDHVGRHNDRPLLGYEAARLVLQLDRDWSAQDGGLFRAFAGETVIVRAQPSRNCATAFALTEASLHEVSETHRTRRSVVFHFWHVGNSIALKEWVHRLFANMSFGALPALVLELADVAEVELPESDTHRAASVAVALGAWGYDAGEAAAGYTRALSGPVAPASELDIAVALARWFQRLYVEYFDPAAWAVLRDRLNRLEPGQYPRLREPWRIAFGQAVDLSVVLPKPSFYP